MLAVAHLSAYCCAMQTIPPLRDWNFQSLAVLTYVDQGCASSPSDPRLTIKVPAAHRLRFFGFPLVLVFPVFVFRVSIG